MPPENAFRGLYAQRRFVPPRAERCTFCRSTLDDDGTYLFDVARDELCCACAVCAQRQSAAGSARFRAVRSHREALPEFRISDGPWRALGLPVGFAFLVRREAEGPLALYPGAGGLMRASVSAETWAGFLTENPSLAEMKPHVEALLVNRRHGRRECFRVSIDQCYALAETIRQCWRGLSGGPEVWDAIEGYVASCCD